MAYVSAQSGSARTQTMIAVAVLEAAGIYALIAGLSYVVNPPVPDERPITYDIPKAVPKPSEPPKDRHAQPDRPSPSQAPSSSASASPSPLASASPFTGEGPGTATASPSPLPTAEPSRKAVATSPPTPRGRPGDWVTRNDYPAQDLREGNEGLVRFRLGVGADGRVTNCTVTATSGFPRLDAAACAKLTQRGRFNPATNDSGAKVAGAYYGMLRWRITD